MKDEGIRAVTNVLMDANLTFSARKTTAWILRAFRMNTLYFVNVLLIQRSDVPYFFTGHFNIS
jgi:hypothetical protein